MAEISSGTHLQESRITTLSFLKLHNHITVMEITLLVKTVEKLKRVVSAVGELDI